MAEAERRPSKTPLRKQPEIEEVDEELNSQSKDGNSVCVNKMIDTAHVNSSSGQEERSSSDSATSSMPMATNGAGAAAAYGESSDMMSSSLQSATTEVFSTSPETVRKDRPLKINHSFSAKAKPLMRGTAIDDSVGVPTPEVKVITTPAPDNDDSPYEYNVHVAVPLLGQDGAMGHRSVLQKNGSLSSDAGTSNCSLSRESSVEKIYKDSSGVDLEEFIKKTLLKSKKDKQMLLSLEKDFRIFVESQDQHYQLAEMCSYDRMICHRVAAFYGMDHNIDKSGKCVIVSKTKFTRIPTFSCEEYIRTVEPDDSGSERKQMRLLKKPASMEERSRGDKAQFSSHRTKSLEERQRHYDEKRKIIFGASLEEGHGVPVIENMPSGVPNKRLNSREWSSTDSSGYVSEEGSRLRRNLMAKSNSYGDSITSGTYESAPVRTKQASPENSQSPISCSGRSSADVNSPSQVQPHTNADGTPYRYNPNDPNSVPPWLSGSGGGGPTTNTSQHHQPQISHMGYNHAPSVQPVQYTISGQNDLSNRFSTLELGGATVGAPPSMETSLQDGQPPMMTALGHHPHSSQPHHHHHHHHHPPQQVAPALQQPTSQMPLMVSASLGMQPAPQFMQSFAAGPTAQGQAFYTGAPVQFVQLDAQGQCVPMATGPSQTGMVTYGQPHILQPASQLQQAAMLDQSTLGNAGGYGQSMYGGSMGAEAGNTYCVPAYMTPVNSIMYPAPPTHYPANGMALAHTGATHYGAFSAPQQSSSPQLTFAPLQSTQVRPATPPSLSLGQAAGYLHSQQGLGLGHGVSSPPQLQPGTYYAAPQPHPFSTQAQPVGQVVQMSIRGGGVGACGVPVSTTHHPHMSHQGGGPGQHTANPNMQHSQSYPIIRQVPPSSAAPTPLAIGPAPNPAPTPPQHHQHHPMLSVKSLSMGNIRGAVGGGAATPDKETAPTGGMGVGFGGGGSFLANVSQMTTSGATMQFPGQLMTPGMRQPQPGDLRVVGAASIRSQITPSLIAIQPGQHPRNKSSGPRQSRPPRRNNSNVGGSNASQTSASASVARVMSLDSGASLHQPINRP